MFKVNQTEVIVSLSIKTDNKQPIFQIYEAKFFISQESTAMLAVQSGCILAQSCLELIANSQMLICSKWKC